MILLKAFYLLLAYLIGAIPFGLILSVSWAGIDPREVGSGNIGATNVHRVAGERLGAATLALDALKGLLPVLGAWALFDSAWAPGLVGVLAVIGHCWPIYLELKGGKGVATGAGVMLGLAPWATLLAALIWGGVFAFGRRSSLAGLAAACAMPLLAWWLHPAALGPSLVLAGLIGVRHRSNIARLAAGTEAQIGG